MIAEGVLVAQRMLASRFTPHAFLGTDRRLAELGEDLDATAAPFYRASAEVMAAAFGLGGLVMIPVLLTQPLAWLATPSGLAMALWLGLHGYLGALGTLLLFAACVVHVRRRLRKVAA